MKNPVKTDTKNLVSAGIGLVVTVLSLSVVVYYGSRAWKKGQTGEKLF